MPDNLRLDITHWRRECLEFGCRIVFAQTTERTATHWRLDEVPAKEDWRTGVDDARVERLILFLAEGRNSRPLPKPLDCGGAADLLWDFLQGTRYGPEPDHEGFNKKGWRLFNEAWGRIGDESYSFVALEPRWMLYGK